MIANSNLEYFERIIKENVVREKRQWQNVLCSSKSVEKMKISEYKLYKFVAYLRDIEVKTSSVESLP